MKKLNYLLFSINVVLISLIPFQTAFAVDVPLKKGDNPGGTIGTNSVVRSSSLRTMTVNPVTASLNENELVLDFGSSVGVAQITISDANRVTVYQNAVNTSSTSEVVITTDMLDSGNYTLKIIYGTTSLTGRFQLY